jgi:hypothetical protein
MDKVVKLIRPDVRQTTGSTDSRPEIEVALVAMAQSERLLRLNLEEKISKIEAQLAVIRSCIAEIADVSASDKLHQHHDDLLAALQAARSRLDTIGTSSAADQS